MSQGIYKITNLTNGDCYVGQSVNIEKRWKDHIHTSTNKKVVNYKYPLYNSIRKYGTENFKFEILELVPNKNDLTIKEQFYYDLYKPEYCLIEPKNSALEVGRKSVHKIDIRTLEIIDTYESLLQAANQNNLDFRTISLACHRKIITSGDFYWVFTTDYNEKWKPKKRNTTYEKTKVLQFDLQNNFIKEYKSISYAAKITGINKTNISRNCKGIYKQAKGFIWRYAVYD
jgi:group I intron endonuclease